MKGGDLRWLSRGKGQGEAPQRPGEGGDGREGQEISDTLMLVQLSRFSKPLRLLHLPRAAALAPAAATHSPLTAGPPETNPEALQLPAWQFHLC